MDWTREIDPDFSPNPAWLRLGDADFEAYILQKVPQPVPAGVSQVYQVVKLTRLIVDGNCKPTFRIKFLLDIVNIAGRDEIRDYLSLNVSGEGHCIVVELAEHRIGFGSKTETYRVYQSEEIPPELAEEVKRQMTPPITSFQTSYAFYRGDCCRDRLPFFGLFTPEAGEKLLIEGLGEFSRPGAAPPPPPPPPPPPDLPPLKPKPSPGMPARRLRKAAIGRTKPARPR